MTQAVATKDAIVAIQPQITQILPSHVRPERYLRAVTLAVAQNRALAEANVHSLRAAVLKAAELGLVPNSPLGEAYLIPFKGEVQMIPGYRGLISLARRSGDVSTIEARVVYEGEPFVYRVGPSGTFEHTPNLDVETEGKRRFAYAWARLKDGSFCVEVVPRWKIEAIKRTSLAKIKNDDKREQSPWVAHEGEMWRKTAVRALFKYLPVSSEMIARALEADDDASGDAFAEVEVSSTPVARGNDALRERLGVAPASEAPSPEELPENQPDDDIPR